METRDEIKTFIPRGNNVHIFEEYLETRNSHCEISHTVVFIKILELAEFIFKTTSAEFN